MWVSTINPLKALNIYFYYKIFSLDNDVLAALCIMNKDKLELKIDNVFFLSSQTILKINPTIYNVVLAVRVT